MNALDHTVEPYHSRAQEVAEHEANGTASKYGRLYALPQDDGDTIHDRERDIAIQEMIAEMRESES